MKSSISRPHIFAGVSIAAMGAALLAGPAAAQQVVVGSSECPIVDEAATCEGDLSDGVINHQDLGHAPVFSLDIQNITGAIEPAGYYGVAFVRSDGDLTLNIADDVFIDVYDDLSIPGAAQGVVALAGGGHSLTVTNGATIWSAGGSGPGVGIEADAAGTGGSVMLTNSGSVSASSYKQITVALLSYLLDGADGTIAMSNSGSLAINVSGAGERDVMMAGIGASDNGAGGGASIIDIANTGDKDMMIRAADVQGAGMAMLHETSTWNNQTDMQEVFQQPVAAGETVKFEPGGLHVMASDLDPSLVAGGTTEVTLTFVGGDKVSFPAEVLAAGDAR